MPSFVPAMSVQRMESKPLLSYSPPPMNVPAPVGTSRPLPPQSAPAIAAHGTIPFGVFEFQIGDQAFDPTTESVKTQLLSKLQISGPVAIDVLPNAGGLNSGMWTLRSASREDLILKLVSASKAEGDMLLNLHRSHPAIIQDPSLSFPVQIFQCLGSDGRKRYDLFIMEKAHGESLADYIGKQWWVHGPAPVMRVLKQVGRSLRDFHTRYHKSQHGDFQPSNIFYDEAADKITLIDIAGMGAPTHHTDKEHFHEALKLIAPAYELFGAKFLIDASQAFEEGYSQITRCTL